MFQDIIDNILFINNSSTPFPKDGHKVATAFVIQKDNKKYIISARHVFENDLDRGTVTFEHIHSMNAATNTITGTLYKHPQKEVDIVVVVADGLTQPGLTFNRFTNPPIFLSEFAFAGFPYGYLDNFHGGVVRPFFKKGFFSATHIDGKNIITYFLDGHTNPGFSGGPVIGSDNNNWMFLGVMSACQDEYIGYGLDHVNKVKINVIGNSGIIRVCSFSHALEIIRLIP